MKYDFLIEKHLKRLSSLQKVRIKTDPRFISQESDLSKCPAYEGYVLEEGANSFKVLVLPPDFSIQDIPVELIETLADEHEESVFAELIMCFIQRLGLKEGDPLMQQFFNCCSIDEIEQFALQHGLTTNDITNIYKEFILS